MISFCFKYIVKEYKNARFGFVLIFLTHIVYAIGTRQLGGATVNRCYVWQISIIGLVNKSTNQQKKLAKH